MDTVFIFSKKVGIQGAGGCRGARGRRPGPGSGAGVSPIGKMLEKGSKTLNTNPVPHLDPLAGERRRHLPLHGELLPLLGRHHRRPIPRRERFGAKRRSLDEFCATLTFGGQKRGHLAGQKYKMLPLLKYRFALNLNMRTNMIFPAHHKNLAILQ